MSRSRAKKGAPMAWLRTHAAHEGSDCLIWPFSRKKSGRPSMGRGGTPSRVMCVLAHGEPPTPRHEAAHSCGKNYDGCVHPKHLRWATHAENMDDKFDHGTVTRGSAIKAAKLTEADVVAIRALRPQLTLREIGDRFGVCEASVSLIARRKNWKHVA